MDYNTYHELLLSSGSIPAPVILPEVPLYRYRKNDEHALDEIKNQYVFTSYAGKQNDPFDSSCRMSFEEALEYKQEFKYYFLTYRNLKLYRCYDNLCESCKERFNSEVSLGDFSLHLSNALKIEGIIESSELIAKFYYDNYWMTVRRRNYWEIASFSEKRDSIPMWAYYASNHTGLCFKYDFCLLDKKEQYNRCIMESLHKVWYSNNKPNDPEGSFSYLVKAQDWSHEQEWRLVNWQQDNNRIALPCMTEVYLGINISSDAIHKTIEAIKASGRNIRLFWCRPNLQEYRIDFMEIYYSS